MSSERSVVDEVTDQIAFDIASGVYAAGDRLPSVRALATRHGINPSTVQVVVERLRAAGFIEASRGLGLSVRDIEQYGGIETWRYLFRFAVRLPDRATALLEDFLRTRRVLVLEVARAIEADPAAFDLRALRRAVEGLQLLADSEGPVEAFARAELQTARLLLQRVDRPVLLAIYNSIADILLSVPAALEAIYVEPRFNVAMWRSLIDAWERGTVGEVGIEQADAMLAAFHVTCVARFREIIRTVPSR
jgi:GntR family transcriptional regulator, transcriptional repressor for pyruvate dehydrogenase complex